MNKNILKYTALLLPLASCNTEEPNGGGSSAGGGGDNGNVEKPNYIVIMCDDLGYEDVSFNLVNRSTSEVSTPNIDKIADQGVHFTSGYVTYSVSGPSRAGFMTGRYQQRFGFERNPDYRTSAPVANEPYTGLPLDEMTIAESLKKAGYTNGIIGKWHLGAQEANLPNNRGFDYFFGHLGGGHRYFPSELTIENYTDAKTETDSYQTWVMKNKEAVNPLDMRTNYLTDEFTLEALDFIESNKDNPFFLYLAYNAPHAPLQARDGRSVDSNSDDTELKKAIYTDMVNAVDEGVGSVLDKLSELKLDENTVIFFLSDNGGAEDLGANNGVLRDGKSSIYDGGFRVPFAMRWSGRIAPQQYDKAVSSLDIFATISALSDSPIAKPLDGANLIPYLNGSDRGYPHPTIFLRKYDQNRYAVRYFDYKYLRFPTDKNNIYGEQTEVLYNIVENISEVNSDGGNIVNTHPEKANELSKIVSDWDEQLVDPVFDGT